MYVALYNIRFLYVAPDVFNILPKNLYVAKNHLIYILIFSVLSKNTLLSKVKVNHSSTQGGHSLPVQYYFYLSRHC